MDMDKNGSNILLTILLTFVLLLSYSVVPVNDSKTKTHKVSQKMHTKSEDVANDAKKQVSEPLQVKEIKETAEKKSEQQPQKVEPGPETRDAVTPVSNDDVMVLNSRNAGSTASATDIIDMNNPAYSSHKKGIVRFTHKKHIDTYGINCGRCHHDDTGNPLELTAKDSVKGCIECHRGTKKPKGEKLDKKTRIMTYHFEALHANCVGCHKEFNIEKGDPKGKGPAPISCTKCHPKN